MTSTDFDNIDLKYYLNHDLSEANKSLLLPNMDSGNTASPGTMAITEFEKEAAAARKDSRVGRGEEVREPASNSAAAALAVAGVKTKRNTNVDDLLLDALKAMVTEPVARLRRKHLRHGEVAIILDVNKLSLTCRVRDEDIRRSLPAKCQLREREVDEDKDEPWFIKNHGTTHYFVALKRVEGEAMPRPQRLISEDEVNLEQFYTQGTADSSGHESTDWIRAYGSFFRILSNINPAHHLINTRDVNAALPQIEAVSRIIAAQGANMPRSALTIAFKVLFSDYGSSLWAAIYRDPARWLRVAENLHHEVVYKEALTHLIGRYPSSSTNAEYTVPISDASMSTIKRLGREKQFHKMGVDLELTLLTIDIGKPLAPGKGTNVFYMLLNYFLDYIKEHLRLFTAAQPIEVPPGTFCTHDGATCLRPASFYRLLSKGGDAYLPDKDVVLAMGKLITLTPDHKDTIREFLKLLKAKAAEIVQPLVKSSLNYEKKDQLAYLTNVNLDEEAMPWAQNGMAASGDAESDEEMEY